MEVETVGSRSRNRNGCSYIVVDKIDGWIHIDT